MDEYYKYKGFGPTQLGLKENLTQSLTCAVFRPHEFYNPPPGTFTELGDDIHAMDVRGGTACERRVEIILQIACHEALEYCANDLEVEAASPHGIKGCDAADGTQPYLIPAVLRGALSGTNLPPGVIDRIVGQAQTAVADWQRSRAKAKTAFAQAVPLETILQVPEPTDEG